MSSEIRKNGFTLLEVLAVVIIIGILAALAYSSLMELIQTNKTKEAARTLATFAERALAEGKMHKESVFIKVNGNTVEARFGKNNKNPADLSQILASGFTANKDNNPPTTICEKNYNDEAKAEIRIGTSGMESGCFVVCNSSIYCASAVKTKDKNTFTARIKKKNSTAWEAL